MLEALEWLEQICRKQPLREDLLADYHERIMPRGYERAGKYRKGIPIMADNPLKPPPPAKIRALMKALDEQLRISQEVLDGKNVTTLDKVLEVGVEIYHRIGVIHPFSDGNGRVARLALNHLLRRYDQGYVILPALSESAEHWEALLAAGSGDSSKIRSFARECHFRV